MPRHHVIAVLGALGLAGCGLQSSAPAPAPAPIRIVVEQPPMVSMTLRPPGGGLTAGSALSFATADEAPTVRGTVRPASATVYIRPPGGGLATVQPRRSGAFAVRTDLLPGRNRLEFMAYRLGAITRTARMTITWRGGTVPASPAPALTAIVAGVPSAPGTVPRPATPMRCSGTAPGPRTGAPAGSRAPRSTPG